MRLIDAEKLEEYKADCCVSLTEWQEGWNDAIDMIMSETLTVDVQPVVHGHWIKDSDGFPICSECGEIALQRMIMKVPSLTTTCRLVESNYCPNCGARLV